MTCLHFIALPDELLQEVVPGNIRKAEHFVGFLKRWIEYLKNKLKGMDPLTESPNGFLQHVKEITFLDKKALQFTSERLASLIRTLELVGIDELVALQKVASFATLVACYTEGKYPMTKIERIG